MTSFDTSMSTSYYAMLGISKAATQEEIKDAYKRLAILRHPDKNLADAAGATIAFQKLQAAYSTLSDPVLRAKYDATISITIVKNGASKFTSATAAAAHPSPFQNKHAKPTIPKSPKTAAAVQTNKARSTKPKFTPEAAAAPQKNRTKPTGALNKNHVEALLNALRRSHIKAFDLSLKIQILKQTDGRPEWWRAIEIQFDREQLIQNELKIKLAEHGLQFSRDLEDCS